MDSRSRKMILVLTAAAVLAAAPLSAAASAQAAPPKAPVKVDGTWNMTVTGPDGSPMSVTAVFRTEGKKLTGSIAGPQGEVELEGEYADGKIAFAISVPQDAGALDITFTGTLKDDGSLEGVASAMFGEIPWTAVKSK
jgi:hypothetical protein